MTIPYESLQSVAGLRNLILDPDEVPGGTHANIPQYQGKVIGDVITFIWQGHAGASFSITLPVNAGNVHAPIPVRIAYAPYIIGNLDNSVTVSYTVARKDGENPNSQPLTFLVKRQLG